MTKTFARVMLLVISAIAGKLLFDCFAGGAEKSKKLAPKKKTCCEKSDEGAAEPAADGEKACLLSKLGIDPAALLKQVFAGSQK